MKNFSVIVYYEEPLFCKTIGKDPNTVFKATFVVEAVSTEQALELAKAEFVATARQSWVHWERRIVKCEVNPEK